MELVCHAMVGYDHAQSKVERVMAGFELQRKNMVESQVRPSDITDRRIIRAMLAVPRETFVSQDRSATAYMDQDIPVGEVTVTGRRMLLAPRILAKLMQHLELGEADRVLDVGGATGYSAALAGRVAKSVAAVECDPGLAARAIAALAAIQADNVKVHVGALSAGVPDEGPYNAILIAGGVSYMPAGLLDQLQDGGRLTAILHDGGVGRLTQWRRLGAKFDQRPVMEASAAILPGFERVPGFVF